MTGVSRTPACELSAPAARLRGPCALAHCRVVGARPEAGVSVMAACMPLGPSKLAHDRVASAVPGPSASVMAACKLSAPAARLRGPCALAHCRVAGARCEADVSVMAACMLLGPCWHGEAGGIALKDPSNRWQYPANAFWLCELVSAARNLSKPHMAPANVVLASLHPMDPGFVTTFGWPSPGKACVEWWQRGDWDLDVIGSSIKFEGSAI